MCIKKYFSIYYFSSFLHKLVAIYLYLMQKKKGLSTAKTYEHERLVDKAANNIEVV